MSSSTELAALTPSVALQVNGKDLPLKAGGGLLSVTVQTDVAAPSMFTLRLANWDVTQRKLTWSDDNLLAPGNAVEIQMGYLGKLETLIAGEITSLEPEFCTGAPLVLTVRGYDRRHRLLRGCHTRSFRQMKESDIAQQVASDAGLAAKVTDTGATLDYVLQQNQTDLAFLQERSQRIGYEVVVEDKTLYFRPPAFTGSAALTLARDGDLIEFYPRLVSLNQVDQVAVYGWDFRQKSALVGQAATGAESGKMGGATSGPAAMKAAFGASSLVTVASPVSSQAEADKMALGRFNAMSLDYISGEGVCVGRPGVRAGVLVELTGFGQRFSGLYYVTAATHSYSTQRGYRTTFAVRRNAT